MAIEERRQRADHWGQQDVDLALLTEDQFAVMARDAFHRIAAIDSAASAPISAALIFRRFAGEHDVLRRDAERRQQAHPELVGGPDIEYARNADAQLTARLRRDGRRWCEPFPPRLGKHVWLRRCGPSRSAFRRRP